MNNTNSTEELLKAIDLTLDDVYNIIKEGVTKRYSAFGRLREIVTPEDLTQDVLLYYLSTMKSTGDVRLNYYIKKYNDRIHVINLIKQTSYQFPLHLLNNTLGLHKVISIDTPINYDIDNKTVGSLAVDRRAESAIYSNVTDKELMDLLKEELNRLNVSVLKQRYDKESKDGYNEYHLPFLLDTNNYVKAYNKTLTQLQIIKDLKAGYTKKDLTAKYTNFVDDINIIKKAFLGKLYTYIRTF